MRSDAGSLARAPEDVTAALSPVQAARYSPRMLVYGDAERLAAPSELIDGIRASLAAAAALSGIGRHAALVAALIEAGELAQGLADHAFAANGEVETPDPTSDAALRLTRVVARQVAASWDGGFAASSGGDGAATALAELARRPLPASLRVKQPEGFAHYALYPEAYLEAARRIPADGPALVIGLRSIGTTLAAMAAEGLRSPALIPASAGMSGDASERPDDRSGRVSAVLTLRPSGHPFDRRIAISEAVGAALSRHVSGPVVIADEGPGLSGSSVAAAIRAVEERAGAGVAIHVLPGHAGEPGPEASAATRAAWGRAARHVAPFDELVLGAPHRAHRLESWCADLVGEAVAPLVEISGGAWRPLFYSGEAEWPPAAAGQERRKFLLESARGTVLLRFAGLGRIGERKLVMARRLHEAGFVPEPLGLRHGFLVERWHGDAAPLAPGHDRAGLLGRLGAYLGFRARAFPAGPGRGASVETLHAMALRNGRDVLDAGGHARLERWRAHLGRLERARRPVATDNRLHAWEWLVADGRLLKTDAVDHHEAHDLVGCQDIAWDVAGAAVELGLSDDERGSVTAGIERVSGIAVDGELLAFLTPCYLAFQHGAFVMAARAAGDEAEHARLAGAARRYARALTTV